MTESLPMRGVRAKPFERLLSGLPEQVLRANARKVAEWKAPAGAIRRMLKRDYVRSLRRHLGYNGLQRSPEADRRVWKDLSRL
jgi:hypothetical protein